VGLGSPREPVGAQRRKLALARLRFQILTRESAPASFDSKAT